MKKYNTRLFALLLTALVFSLIAQFLIDGSLWWEHSRPKMIEKENLQLVLEQIEESGIDTTKLHAVLRPKHTFWSTFLIQLIGLTIVLFVYKKNIEFVAWVTNKKRPL